MERGFYVQGVRKIIWCFRLSAFAFVFFVIGEANCTSGRKKQENPRGHFFWEGLGARK